MGYTLTISKPFRNKKHPVEVEPSVAIRQGQGVADGVSRPNGQRKEMHSLAPWP